jgi:predicted lipid carrier protein YhbT
MKIPAFVIPKPLGRAVARLPQLPPTLMLVTALNLALGRILPRDRLEPLTGKRLLIAVTDAGLSLRFSLTTRGFVPTLDRSEEPDLRIAASARDFLALVLREEDPDTLFFSRRLLMEGDTDLGLLVKNTLDAVELPDLAALAPQRLLDRLLRPAPR